MGVELAGVITMGSDIPDIVAAVAERLELPHLERETAALATDKLAMKERFRERGVAIPWFAEVRSELELRKIVAERGSELVLKPVDRSGSRGVFLLDPTSDLARKLMDQIKADPQKELGATFFRYTVQRDDSLSKIAQQYLGDRYKFHILAKYNDIPNPSKLAAGQVIKVPGRAPPPGTPKPAAPAPTPEPTDEAAKAASPESATPRSALRVTRSTAPTSSRIALILTCGIQCFSKRSATLRPALGSNMPSAASS